GKDAKTVRKYLKQEDFSPRPQESQVRPSRLDPYKALIDSWLEDDKKNWYKQRHTSQRIYNRLVEQYPAFDCSYPTVVRYVRQYRNENQPGKGFQELVWHPGEAQVDFGEADFMECQCLVRKKYLTVSFPYSNDSFSQVFGGETAECVCQGLQDIFNYIGGVPSLLIFDNATGVGRRVGDKISEAKLFSQFRAHYSFGIRFCNPRSGNEKGNVENKVGFTRRNLFVPLQTYEDIETFNRDLLAQHKSKAEKLHYKKLVPIHELFQADQEALHPLPAHPFNVCRYESYIADAYGKVCLDERHHYASCPEYGGKPVLVGLRAHTVEILTKDLTVLTCYKRKYGSQRTDHTDYRTTLATLMRNLGAWPNSGIREQLPESLRQVLDEQSREDLRRSLGSLERLCQTYDLDTAISALDERMKLNRARFDDITILAARIQGYGLNRAQEKGPDLKTYDQLLKGDRHACNTEDA
ncbi:IS21 family transposase, partial [Oscillospiraceae bacterium HV4-5-C5C]|nr:IS21 family transposase [Oscillospiraceae bacterium HV4-5-C5C]